MGRHKQQSLLLYSLGLPIGLEHAPISIPSHWPAVGISPILHRGQPKGGNQKYRKGKPRGRRGPLWVLPVPMSRECLSNKRSVCLRRTELWLVCCFKAFSPSFQIFVAVRQELRKKNKLTWQYYNTLKKLHVTCSTKTLSYLQLYKNVTQCRSSKNNRLNFLFKFINSFHFRINQNLASSLVFGD